VVSSGAEEAADFDDVYTSDYPERFVTSDAVYTLHAVEFVPPSNPNISSLFDDSPAAIRRTWERAKEVGNTISSANEETVKQRLQDARETVKDVLQRLEERAKRTEAAPEETTADGD
jgi:hypothetical protein